MKKGRVVSAELPGPRERRSRASPIMIGLVTLLLSIACEPRGHGLAPDQGWLRFRGANGSGVAEAYDLPVEFGPDQNVDWSTSVPEGKSSPILAGDRIFLSAVENAAFVTMALDRTTGEVVWRKDLERAREDQIYRMNSSATPTPVSDGTNVYVFFIELGLVSFDGDGNERWRLELGPFDNFYGLGASPILAGDQIVLLCDQVEGSFLLAVDANTGEPRWRRERSGRIESWTTPVLYPSSDEPDSVLIFGATWVDAYALESGEHLWELPGIGVGPVASPVLAGSTLFVTVPNHAEEGLPTFESLAATTDGDGDGRLSEQEFSAIPELGEHFGWADRDKDEHLTAGEWAMIVELSSNPNYGLVAVGLPGDGALETPAVLWSHKQSVPYIASPIVYDNVVYMVRDGGIVTSLDPATGEVHKRGRTSRSAGSVFSSPVAADGKVIIASLEGEIAVLLAGSQWEVLAVNELDEPIYATPALADGRIYVRTPSTLYSFGGGEQRSE